MLFSLVAGGLTALFLAAVIFTATLA